MLRQYDLLGNVLIDIEKGEFHDGLLFGPDIVMVPQFHVIGNNGKKMKNARKYALSNNITVYGNYRSKT